ncbi:MAG: acyl-CoA dehydrogenase family protein [Leptospiraceae bacterium]|nr:acyl-CoA dehydrogenase family protein [Leptospiraceae bacterium]
MIENNYFDDNQDLMDFFQYAVDWPEIVAAYELGFKDNKKYQETSDENLMYAPSTVDEAVEMYKMTLTSVGDIAGNFLAPRASKMDDTGLKFANGQVTFPAEMIEVYEKLKEAGVFAYGMNRKYGGLGQGSTVTSILNELLARGDGAFAIAIGCLNLAETVERFGDAEMIKEWVPKMAAGDVFGAMALTEPNYGSDLPNVQTKAFQDENGHWRLTGTKRFITHGCGFADYPAVILTLARTGSTTSGAKGLSFFLVESKDVEIAGIEKKLGLHCSPTCEVVYDNAPAQIIGKEGFGLVRYAMGMMNTARLSIASQSMGIAAAAYGEAHKYAGEREQFGKLIKTIPAVDKMLSRMDREMYAMRCLLYEAARSVDLYYWKTTDMEHQGMDAREIRKDEQIKVWDKLATFFTPLAKYYNSELCNSIAYDTIQIHGGSGFTEEYDAARIYRDARITNIYEGTTQMQVHAIIGGVAAGMSDNGYVRDYIEGELKRFTPSKELLAVRELFEKAAALYKTIDGSDNKEYRAFEAVESAARFVNGMLMERNAERMPADKQERYKAMAQAYHLDSKAQIQANLIKLEAAQAA